MRWLEKFEMRAGEEKPIGIILCADKSEEQIKIVDLENIHVAQYYTKLPPKEILIVKLNQAISAGKTYFEKNTSDKITVTNT